ncbi:MAG: alcohol dehydrogenase catalytic domain-containing protein, partial [Solirubrobacteraceae bacterium]
MKAILLDRPDARPVLSTDLPVPAPCADEILIRVQASSVNPVDNAIANGMFKGIFEHEFPITLGRDYAGTVEHAGADVDRLSNTDEVFGFIPPARPVVRDGAWSELVVVPESLVAHRPGNVDLATAGAAPLAASTAMTAVDALALSPEDTVLIMGATGGVGSFAVQLAAAAGATVIAPA